MRRPSGLTAHTPTPPSVWLSEGKYFDSHRKEIPVQKLKEAGQLHVEKGGWNSMKQNCKNLWVFSIKLLLPSFIIAKQTLKKPKKQKNKPRNPKNPLFSQLGVILPSYLKAAKSLEID